MKQKLSALVIVILALAMGTTSPRTQSRVEVPQRVADRIAAGESVPVIVGVDATFVPEGDLADRDAVASQRDAIARVVDDVMTRARDTGAVVGSGLGIFPFFTARVDRASLEALAAMRGVTSIVENTVDRVDLASSIPIVNAAPTLAAGITGAGWRVAIADTGIEKTHSFLAPGGATKVVAEACFVNAGGAGTGTSTCPGGGFASTASGSAAPCSAPNDCSHGTHVAGIAAGVNAGGTGVNGVAPGAQLIGLQVFTRFDDQATCGFNPGDVPCAVSYVSDQVLALNHVASLAGANNVNQIAAVNMSLGGGQYFDQLTCDTAQINVNSGRKAAIDNLRSLGIAVVASSGNNGFPTSMGAPGCISSAVSVGSITDALLVSSFSNNAPFLSLYAPGSNVTSSVTGNGFASFNGTSMAAPHVAGAWALMKQALGSASVSAVLAAFQATGTTINDQRGGGGTPHPLININAARLNLLGGGGGGGLPGAPTNFVATVSGNAINMSWNASADAETIQAAATNYNLIARLAPGAAPVVVLPLGNITSFGVNAPNGTFFLSVQGTNASGPGPESNVVQVTVPAVPPRPGNPTNLVVNVVGNSATFTWNAPASGGPVANYVLLASNAPFPAPALVSVPLPASPTAVGFSGIPAGVWFVRVFAQNAGGNSLNSTNEVQFTIAGPAPPGVPTLNAPVVVANNVSLSWTPGAGGAPTSYTPLASATSGGAPFLSVPGLSGTGAAFGGVPSGTYFLRLVAVNALGSSAPSNQVTLTVP
ncbi:MAG: S8 family serine peptidase [Vicinamibacterales bacterium]